MEEAKKTYKPENVIEGEKKDQEVANSQKIRERALESFAETKKRNKYSDIKQKKNTLSSGSETLF